ANGFPFDLTVTSPQGFPEIPTVVEAMSIYFKNIGLKPNLLQIEVAANTNRQRAADFYDAVWSSRQGARPLFRAPDYFWSKSIYHFFEDPQLEERIERFSRSVNPQERSTLLREIGDFAYKAYA